MGKSNRDLQGIDANIYESDYPEEEEPTQSEIDDS